MLILLLIGISNTNAQSSEKTLQIIKWDLGNKVDWDNYDPSQISFSCIYTTLKESDVFYKDLTRILQRKKIFWGILGSKSYIKYSLEFSTEIGDKETYRIMNSGSFIHKKQNYWKMKALDKTLEKILQKNNFKPCDCPAATK